MAADNSTSPTQLDTIPREAIYFERPQGSPSVFDLLAALDGVTEALYTEQVSFSDHAQIERIENLGIAAHILASQLRRRYTVKPMTKRDWAEVRRHDAEQRARREQLAGSAEDAA